MIALAFGWRAAFALVAALGVVIAAVAQSARAQLDAERMPGARAVARRRLRAAASSCSHAARCASSRSTGFVYAAAQMCLMSFSSST